MPKQDLNASNSQNSNLSVFWTRVAAGGNYTLRFAGGSSIRDIPVLVPASTPGQVVVGKVPPSATGSFPANLTLADSVNGHISTVAVSLCAAGTPGQANGYWTVLRAAVGGSVVTIYVLVFGPDYKGPGTYPTYRGFGNGGGEGVTVSVDGGDYYAQPPPTGGAGTFPSPPAAGRGRSTASI